MRVEDLARLVLVEDAAAGQVLHRRGPFRRGPEVVLSTPGGDVLRFERDLEVVVEVAAERRDPEELPSHALAHRLDLLDRRAGHGRIAHIVVLEVGQDAIHVVDLERAADALMLRARRHHEMLYVELASALEEVRQRQLAVGAVETILLLHSNPGKGQAQGRNRIAVPGQCLLMLQKGNPRFEPLFSGYDRVLHGTLHLFGDPPCRRACRLLKGRTAARRPDTAAHFFYSEDQRSDQTSHYSFVGPLTPIWGKSFIRPSRCIRICAASVGVRASAMARPKAALASRVRSS